ncbi:MAG: MBL fold metallo-hydrolase [Myxococcota bacterium]|nr:MBL fold metallo-hydrolase [Myxococcota bacterium]
MRAIALQSGSSGNCIYVEANGVSLLFDAGISGIKAETRLKERGIDIRDVDTVLVSHNHWDHMASVGIFHRKFGLPFYATEGSFNAAAAQRDLGKLREVNLFQPGQSLSFNGVTVDTIPTPHDGVDGVCFVVQSGKKRIGVLTDLGYPFTGLAETIGTLDGVFIESNYDEEMLRTGPYPPFLKKRIIGEGGHISNLEAAELLKHNGNRLKWACLSHLSGENNTPACALRTSRSILGDQLPLHVASRDYAGEILSI